MKKKNNFNQAMYDMFGVGSDDSEELDQVEMTGEQAETAAPESAAEAESTSTQVVPAAPVSGYANTPVSAAPYVLVPATYLAPGTEFEGHFKSKGDVEIAGKFTGNIESEGDVTLHTFMEGNITATNCSLLDGELKGDCFVTNRLLINSASRIEGNVVAGDLVCSGAIQGNSEVKGNSSFDSTADVVGDITTGSMCMERGASISGSLTMKGSRR